MTLQISAGAAVATVTGFQKDEASKKCESEQFFPVFHFIQNFSRFEVSKIRMLTKTESNPPLLLQNLCHRYFQCKNRPQKII